MLGLSQILDKFTIWNESPNRTADLTEEPRSGKAEDLDVETLEENAIDEEPVTVPAPTIREEDALAPVITAEEAPVVTEEEAPIPVDEEAPIPEEAVAPAAEETVAPAAEEGLDLRYLSYIPFF